MDKTSIYLQRLSDLPNFKIYNEEGLHIEADGVKFNGSWLCMEEAIEEAYLFIKSRIMAKELVKQAKITIE